MRHHRRHSGTEALPNQSPGEPTLRASAVGWRAYETLGGHGGEPALVAATAASLFVRIGGVLVWVGPDGAPLHPRAVLVAPPVPDTVAGLAHLTVADIVPWRPPGIASAPAGRIAQVACALLDRLGALGAPLGFGPLLTGQHPAFPLDSAAPLVDSFAEACRTGQAEEARRAARPLIGLGPGLTPSGDDLVGGAFFGRVVLAATADERARWKDAGSALSSEAASATHPVSAVLLGDLLAGHAHAPLHDLAGAFAAADHDAAMAAGRRIVTIGHSSGWDMLAGVLIGLLGSQALVRKSG